MQLDGDLLGRFGTGGGYYTKALASLSLRRPFTWAGKCAVQIAPKGSMWLGFSEKMLIVASCGSMPMRSLPVP